MKYIIPVILLVFLSACKETPPRISANIEKDGMCWTSYSAAIHEKATEDPACLCNLTIPKFDHESDLGKGYHNRGCTRVERDDGYKHHLCSPIPNAMLEAWRDKEIADVLTDSLDKNCVLNKNWDLECSEKTGVK